MSSSSLCSDEKLREFGYDHYTFINQIFGDETVREDISKIWKRQKYRFNIEEADERFDEGSDHHRLKIVDKRGRQRGFWCSVDGCDVPGEECDIDYQNRDRDVNDTLCQSYTLLKYFNKELTLDRVKVQKNMVDMYRQILANQKFISGLDTIDIKGTWKDYRENPHCDEEDEEQCPILDMDTETVISNIERVLKNWEDYGYYYFIGNGKCPRRIRPKSSQVKRSSSQMDQEYTPPATRSKRQRLSSGGTKKRKTRRSLKRKTSSSKKRSSTRKLSPNRRSKRLQSKYKKNKNKQT